MATAKKKPEELPTKKQPEGALAPSYDYGTMQGQGYEGTTQEDFAIPYLNVLQALSPEVGGQGEEGIVEGAKPGMLINSVTKELFKEIIFVPVATQHVFVEWRPRESGGGIVGRHEITSPVVVAAKAHCEFGKFKTDEGNDLVETFYMFGFMLANERSNEPGMPLVISFWSTKIRKYKQIMQTLRTFKGRPPLFAHRLRIRTVSEKNPQGNFYNFDIVPAYGDVAKSLIPPKTESGEMNPLMIFGQELHKSVRSGERRAADESLSQQDTPQEKEPF